MFNRAARSGRTGIGAACRKARRVERTNSIARRRLETDRSAICRTGRFPIERPQDEQFGHFTAIADTLIKESADIFDAQGGQRGVIEPFGPDKVVAAKADVREDAYATRSS